MSKGTFRKVGKSSKTLYGPRAMLVCGFTPEEQKAVVAFVKGLGMKSVPVIFAVKSDGNGILQELMSRPDQSGFEEHCPLERTIVLSGITESELHKILSSYRGTGLPQPLWATLTPVSHTWPLSDLVEELKKERAAIERKRQTGG